MRVLLTPSAALIAGNVAGMLAVGLGRLVGMDATKGEQRRVLCQSLNPS